MIERIHQTRGLGKFVISIVCLLGVAGLSSCGASLGTGVPQPTAEELADLKMVMDGAQTGVPITLDFSDELHYRYILRQLESAGLTEDTAPKLFTAIDASRQPPPPTNGSNHLGGPDVLGEPPTFSVRVETSDGMNYTATGEVNLPFVLPQLILNLRLYDEYTDRIIALDAEAKYDCDGTITITAAGQADVRPILGRKVTALLTWVYMTSYEGDEPSTVSTGIVKSSYTYDPPKPAKRFLSE